MMSFQAGHILVMKLCVIDAHLLLDFDGSSSIILRSLSASSKSAAFLSFYSLCYQLIIQNTSLIEFVYQIFLSALGLCGDLSVMFMLMP